MFIVYILFSPQLDKYYIGYTGQQIAERLYKHLNSNTGFTSRAKDWDVVYLEKMETKKAAMLREKEIKSWKSSVKIKSLIASSSTE